MDTFISKEMETVLLLKHFSHYKFGLRGTGLYKLFHQLSYTSKASTQIKLIKILNINIVT